jgi:hypothetical protein
LNAEESSPMGGKIPYSFLAIAPPATGACSAAMGDLDIRGICATGSHATRPRAFSVRMRLAETAGFPTKHDVRRSPNAASSYTNARDSFSGRNDDVTRDIRRIGCDVPKSHRLNRRWTRLSRTLDIARAHKREIQTRLMAALSGAT